MSSTTSNDVINVKPNLGCCFFMFFSCFLVRSIDTWKVSTSTQYTFPVCKCMIRLRICAHCILCHIRCFGINITSMWNHCIFICFIYFMWFFNRPSTLGILAFIFDFFQIPITPGYQWWMYTFSINATLPTTHDLVTCRHFVNWGGNSERNVESLITILPSSSLVSLWPPSFVSLTRLLCNYITSGVSNIIA